MKTRVNYFSKSMLLHGLNQMLAVIEFSQHRVLTPKTDRPCSLLLWVPDVCDMSGNYALRFAVLRHAYIWM